MLYKGDRVKLNREGCKADGRPSAKRRIGTIHAEPRKSWKNWPTVAVLWDGLKAPQYWAISLLQKARARDAK